MISIHELVIIMLANAEGPSPCASFIAGIDKGSVHAKLPVLQSLRQQKTEDAKLISGQSD